MNSSPPQKDFSFYCNQVVFFRFMFIVLYSGIYSGHSGTFLLEETEKKKFKSSSIFSRFGTPADVLVDIHIS